MIIKYTEFLPLPVKSLGGQHLLVLWSKHPLLPAIQTAPVGLSALPWCT